MACWGLGAVFLRFRLLVQNRFSILRTTINRFSIRFCHLPSDFTLIDFISEKSIHDVGSKIDFSINRLFAIKNTAGLVMEESLAHLSPQARPDNTRNRAWRRPFALSFLSLFRISLLFADLNSFDIETMSSSSFLPSSPSSSPSCCFSSPIALSLADDTVLKLHPVLVPLFYAVPT